MALLQASLGGGLKLSTGILVIYADEESFTFMTPQGHMFAGWITFSAFERGRRDGRTGAGSDAGTGSADRAGTDPRRHRKEDAFWARRCVRSPSGWLGQPAGDELVCVERRRQWSRAGNVRHNSAFKSGIHTATSPFRKKTNAGV